MFYRTRAHLRFNLVVSLTLHLTRLSHVKLSSVRKVLDQLLTQLSDLLRSHVSLGSRLGLNNCSLMVLGHLLQSSFLLRR
jgi:hypothetical protein